MSLVPISKLPLLWGLYRAGVMARIERLLATLRSDRLFDEDEVASMFYIVNGPEHDKRAWQKMVQPVVDRYTALPITKSASVDDNATLEAFLKELRRELLSWY